MATKEKKDPKETPLMKQYYAIKAKHPNALLLFRVGDFYETFSEDAIKTSKILGIVLTQRRNGSSASIELAGFPYHSLDVYLPKLVRAGLRVAICDQLEDAKQTKSIVKRGVTEMVTPGVSFNSQILDSNQNNFLAAIHFSKDNLGAAFLDVSTGEFFVAEGPKYYIEKLVAGFNPSEILFERSQKNHFKEVFGNKYHTYHLENWAFQHEFGYESLTRHFKTQSLKGFGIEDHTLAVIAAGAALQYVSDTQHDRIHHISQLSRIDGNDHVWLDRFTQRNLELFGTSNEGGKSLLNVLDKTITPMGSRLMKQWLAFPLNNIEAINQRLNSVEAFYLDEELRLSLIDQLKRIGDLERMVSRLAIGKLGPKEAIQLARSLSESKPIERLLKKNKTVKDLAKGLDNTDAVINLIHKYLQPDPPAILTKGNVIADGIDQELDDLRKLAFSGKDYLVQIQERESELTGISSLKIGFNNVFGYYLEVTNVHKDKVPQEWMRKQTLTNAERYITAELKEYEEKILGAEEKIMGLEIKLYELLLDQLQPFISAIQSTAKKLAEIDCLTTFSLNAINWGYSKPVLNQSHCINIKEGRHPVIEQEMSLGESYIANDVILDNETQQIIMLTGPNMAGKSALLRQTALISLMAQIGSYVPAKSADLGIIDKLFTRVGASDNISQGESTFMVEMNETASILNNLSNRSLILLDEIGRGTSTYDGISIAWSIAEYLHAHSGKPLTLFATHYHELNEMAKSLERIKNYTISIKETKDKIVFLRKLIPGGSEHSFGIHVAKMAGMPNSLIKRAHLILNELENSNRSELSKDALKSAKDEMQLSFFQLDDPVLSQIRDEISTIDINSLTPVEALFKLNEIKKVIGKRP
ncbi:MAG TPA: DNA mismatch repair protein MutS [Flavobacteriales bacterium]|nr:DNA mismatch repair protein MutS [Flavobacteriales bacterium]